MIVENINTLISGELLKNEKVLWTGNPNHKKIFAKGDIFLIPFSIIWLSIAFIWEFIALYGTKEGGMIDILFPIIGIVFILFGLYFSFGRFIYKRYRKKNTHYIITNNRIFIIKNGRKIKVSSELINGIGQVSKQNSGNGRGTIIFDKIPSYQAFFFDTGMEFISSYRTKDTMIFYDVENVNRVYQIIMEIKKDVSS